MLLTEKETTIAYRCPHCGASIYSMVGVFALSGDLLKLKCECGESELTIQRTPDGKVRLSVPCIVCAKPHIYTLGQNTFFQREGDAFRLPCTYTGLDLCFIGRKEEVDKAIQKANDELLALMKEAGLDDIESLHAGDDVLADHELDPQVEDMVRYTIAELNDEGKIHCKCQNNAIAHYDYHLHDGKLTIYCDECEAGLTIPMEGLTMAEQFLHSDSLTLE